MRENMCIVIAVSLVGYASCHALGQVPETVLYTQATAQERAAGSAQNALVVPERLEGPLDETLSKKSKVSSVRTAVSPKGEVAIAWEATRFARKVGLFVLGRDNSKSTVFINKNGANPYWMMPYKSLVWHKGHWYLLWSTIEGEIPNRKVRGALVRVDKSGGKIVTTMPNVEVSTIGDWIFSRGDVLDVFSAGYYNPPFSFPDSGMENQRVTHFSGKLNSWGRKTTIRDIHWRELRVSREQEYQVLQHTSGKYDLLFEKWGTPLENPYRDIYCIRNILASGGRITPIGRCYINSTRSAVVLPNGGVVVMWLENPRSTIPSRIVATEYNPDKELSDEGWTEPIAITRGVGSYYSSLAAAATADERVYAVWRNKEKNLTYICRSSEGIWGNPANTSLHIGEYNWLISREQGLVLVTKIDGNLYWCQLITHKLNLPPANLQSSSLQAMTRSDKE